MGKREPQTIDDRSIHPEIRAMANSPRNQPVASQPAGGTASTVSFGGLKRRCIGDGVAAETALQPSCAVSWPIWRACR
jgi:hypothetical protein